MWKFGVPCFEKYSESQDNDRALRPIQGPPECRTLCNCTGNRARTQTPLNIIHLVLWCPWIPYKTLTSSPPHPSPQIFCFFPKLYLCTTLWNMTGSDEKELTGFNLSFFHFYFWISALTAPFPIFWLNLIQPHIIQSFIVLYMHVVNICVAICSQWISVNKLRVFFKDPKIEYEKMTCKN